MTFAFLRESWSTSKVARFLVTGVKVAFPESLPTRILRHGVVGDGTHGAFPISLSKLNPETTNFVIFGGAG
jgi:hypothetical protein